VTSLPYVLVILFALGDGSVITMNTEEQFSSPLSCSMKAFIENEKSRGRTFICVTRDHAVRLVANNPDDRLPKAAKKKQPAPLLESGLR
tara:strand:+ start:1646 stop:1912 length:267 start_codon:yes stop_codon:yes gene_type:complete